MRGTVLAANRVFVSYDQGLDQHGPAAFVAVLCSLICHIILGVMTVILGCELGEEASII